VIVSRLKLSVAMLPVAVLACALFGFNVLSLGFAFAAFFANLILTSWTLGLVSTGVVLSWGLGAESFPWLIVFVLLPVVCVYSPCRPCPAGCSPLPWRFPRPTSSRDCAPSSPTACFTAAIWPWRSASTCSTSASAMRPSAGFSRRRADPAPLFQMGE
jgi:hypothetical protein